MDSLPSLPHGQAMIYHMDLSTRVALMSSDTRLRTGPRLCPRPLPRPTPLSLCPPLTLTLIASMLAKFSEWLT